MDNASNILLDRNQDHETTIQSPYVLQQAKKQNSCCVLM
ncbi:hypothetical protein HYQ46_013269 [Verticillium longisporum]|nr:hypothetical protein HYQ46_013269 [Verticillium longisporum]